MFSIDVFFLKCSYFAVSQRCTYNNSKDKLYYLQYSSIVAFLVRNTKIFQQHWSNSLKPSRSSVPLSRRARLVSVTSDPRDSSSPLRTGRSAQPSRPVRSSSQGDTGGRPPALIRQTNLTGVTVHVKENAMIQLNPSGSSMSVNTGGGGRRGALPA